MDADTQYAQSRKYVAHPYCILPALSGQWAILSGFPARELLAILPPEKVLGFLETSWEERQAAHAKAKHAHAKHTHAHAPIDSLSLDDILGDLEL